MCVLALAWKAHPRWQAVLIGNRDEFHDRPTAALAPWPDATLLAGRDLRAGGSWLGTDGRGRLGVLTNVRDPAAATGGPSRGALVTDFLRSQQTASEAISHLHVSAPTYAPFNLLLADDSQAHWLGNHPPAQQQLTPGIHNLSNAALDTEWPKTRRLHDGLEQWTASAEEDLTALWQTLSDTRQPDDDALPDTGVGLALERTLAPVFITGPHYGTRASTLLAIDENGAGFMIERRFGPNGRPDGQSHYDFDGRGRFTAR